MELEFNGMVYNVKMKLDDNNIDLKECLNALNSDELFDYLYNHYNLSLYGFFLVKLDYIWNQMIYNISKNKKTWIFIDDVELFFKYKAVSVFLTQLFTRCNFFECILTMTTENTHILISNSKQSDSALSMLQNSGYIKLLNTGVLDRDILQKYLNITTIHIPYITGAKPGQGIILTPECNFSFLENMQNTKFYERIVL